MPGEYGRLSSGSQHAQNLQDQTRRPQVLVRVVLSAYLLDPELALVCSTRNQNQRRRLFACAVFRYRLHSNLRFEVSFATIAKGLGGANAIAAWTRIPLAAAAASAIILLWYWKCSCKLRISGTAGVASARTGNFQFDYQHVHTVDSSLNSRDSTNS